MIFIRLHYKGKPFLINMEGVYTIDPKIKGVGCVIMDMGGETRECDETIDEIGLMVGETEVEILEYAND